ncbi:Putative uncharacterized protein [Propionibacterium freudenreichii]|nr:Putative uncharacterized protein [Propionibacterium freudenreichii]
MTAIVPGFAWRPIPGNHHREHFDYSLGLILHVATGGNNSLHGWFSNPAAEASSHWWVGWNHDQAEQYLDPEWDVSWAQAGGNDTYHSVETAGNPDQPLTEAQCANIARIYAWGHARFGWPFRLAEHPGEPGFGWHGMGGADWGGHFDCPGELRKSQRPHILDLAQAGSFDSEENDLTPEQDQMLRNLCNVVFGSGIDRPYDNLPPTDVGNAARWAAKHHFDELSAIQEVGASVKSITDRLERIESRLDAKGQA